MFRLDEIESKKLSEWMIEQDKKIEALWKGKGAPGGAIGGVYTYCFTPTSIGVIIVVKNSVTKEEINVTNFEDW